MEQNNPAPAKFKGYDVVEEYPRDGWLKGYFYADEIHLKDIKPELRQAYRDLGYLRHKDYLLHLLDVRPGEKIIDIGCGDGAMMVYCGLLGAKVYGVDNCPESVERANVYLKRFGLSGEAVTADARNTAFADDRFDKAVSCDFFEHLNYDDKVAVLKEAKRILKPGRKFVSKTPNLTYLRFSKLFKQFVRLLKLKNPLDVIIAHTEGRFREHIGLSTKTEMRRAFKAAGFMNFKFYHDVNSKIEKLPGFFGELTCETPILRDIFTEDLNIVAYKPAISSFFPRGIK